MSCIDSGTAKVAGARDGNFFQIQNGHDYLYGIDALRVESEEGESATELDTVVGVDDERLVLYPSPDLFNDFLVCI